MCVHLMTKQQHPDVVTEIPAAGLPDTFARATTPIRGMDFYILAR